MYDEVFALNTQNQEYTRKLSLKALYWVLCCFTPLSLDSLVQVVALESNGSVDPFVTEDFVLQICSNFIRIKESRDVRFAHRSVKEYLTSRFPQSRLVRHAQAAETCLTFLASLDDETKWGTLPKDPREDTKILRLSSFEIYACFLWAYHCEKILKLGVSDEELIEMRRKRFLLSGANKNKCNAFTKWIHLL